MEDGCRTRPLSGAHTQNGPVLRPETGPKGLRGLDATWTLLSDHMEPKSSRGRAADKAECTLPNCHTARLRSRGSLDDEADAPLRATGSKPGLPGVRAAGSGEGTGTGADGSSLRVVAASQLQTHHRTRPTHTLTM